jgi:hypothetical protein
MSSIIADYAVQVTRWQVFEEAALSGHLPIDPTGSSGYAFRQFNHLVGW